MKNLLLRKTHLLSLAAVIVASSGLEAQNWRGNFDKLVRDNKPAAALQYLWLQSARGTRAEEHIDRALLLESLGFPLSALREWSDAVNANPRLPRALDGLGQGALRWDRLGSVNAAAKAAAGLRSQWPASFRIAVALNAFRAGSTTLAASLLPHSRELGSIRDPEARRAAALHLSSMQGALGSLRDAVQSLDYVSGVDSSSQTGVLRLQAARLYYDMNQMTSSLDQLVKLPRNSGAWYQGVIVGAWAAYRLRDYNLALGQVLTLHSPYLAEKFGPETYILEASTLFQLCQYKSAQKSIELLRQKYAKVGTAAQLFGRAYGNSTSRVSAVVNYARGQREVPLGADPQAYALVMDALLQEDVVARADRMMLQVNFETENLAKIFPDTNQASLAAIKNRYVAELNYARIEAYKDAVRAINRRLRTLRDDVEAAFENASLVEVEVNTRIRERLIDAKVPKPVAVDFEAEVRKGYEFWPFEGEFWRDEVGSYAFATTNVCGEQSL
jgi:tetratricopeptide (TPR) repeat protein